MYHDDSNFEIINGKKVLRDRGRMRVPLRMRDSLRRGTQVVDAYGSTRFHRPGYRFADVTDADIADECRRAYQEYENDLVNAYKTWLVTSAVVTSSAKAHGSLAPSHETKAASNPASSRSRISYPKFVRPCEHATTAPSKSRTLSTVSTTRTTTPSSVAPCRRAYANSR
jgi:hypothetical protein